MFAPFANRLKCVGWPCCMTARGFGLCAADLAEYDEPARSEVAGVQRFCVDACACGSELNDNECNDAAGEEHLSSIPATYTGIFNAVCDSDPTVPCCDGYADSGGNGARRRLKDVLAEVQCVSANGKPTRGNPLRYPIIDDAPVNGDILGGSTGHSTCQKMKAGSTLNTTRLLEWPLVQSHDAATGYICDPGWGGVTNPHCVGVPGISQLVLQWTITQRVDFAGQLTCGARSLDLRFTQQVPIGLGAVHGYKFMFSHGPVPIHMDVDESLRSIVQWANDRSKQQTVCAGAEDLIVLKAVMDDSCRSVTFPKIKCRVSTTDQALASLRSAGINYVVQDGDELRGLTVAQAMELSRLPGGGNVMVVTADVVEDNFDETLTLTKGWDALRAYMDSTATKPVGGPDADKLQEVQAMWQNPLAVLCAGSDASSWWKTQWDKTQCFLDFAKDQGDNAGLVPDNEESDINSKVANWVTTARGNLNFVKIDNTCFHGDRIYHALRSRAV